jgi:outer membrane protein assembly factor BamB
VFTSFLPGRAGTIPVQTVIFDPVPARGLRKGVRNSLSGRGDRLSTTPDHYEVLGVSRDASTEDIERARKKLARHWHPDRNKQEDAAHHFDAVQKAAEVLRDPKLRAEYDRDFAWRAAMSIHSDRRPAGPSAEPFRAPPTYVPYTQAPQGSTPPGPNWFTPGPSAQAQPGQDQPGQDQPGRTKPGPAQPGQTRPHAAGHQRSRRGKTMLLAGIAAVVIVAGAVTAFAMNGGGGTPSAKSTATGPAIGGKPGGPSGSGINPGMMTLPRYSTGEADLPVRNGQVLSIGPTIALLNPDGLAVWRESASVSALNGGTAASGGLQTRNCAVASGAAGRDYDFVSLVSGQQTVVPANPPTGSFALTGDEVALPDGTIREACTGTVTGRAAPRGTFTSTECVLGTTVIGTGKSGQMAWRNGHRLWQVKTKDPVVCDNRQSVVLLNPGAGKISYLDPATGKTRWTIKDPTCARGCLSHSTTVQLLGAAQAVILTDANQVLALNRGNGGVLWQRSGECALQARIAPDQAVLLGSCGQSADPAAADVVNPSSGVSIGTYQVNLAGCSQGSTWSANSRRFLVVCPDPAAASTTDRASLITWLRDPPVTG